ncbi:Elongation factor 2 [Histomonas meleagridis]|uniref:Elongation factor 2 n=1 Tax=Histomonas meleagridis TaxID=135588 RepID=UPI003559D428|nr:Elongation factor 2 [Histomonas meleagridis]KAH0797238.1 Elongation factor 2 [Histomonas meleagridis]
MLVDTTKYPEYLHEIKEHLVSAFQNATRIEYTAKPTLIESVYLAEITAPLTVCGGVHDVLSKRSGKAFDQQQREGTPLMVIKAYLPVMESFGFDKDLRSATSGQAFTNDLRPLGESPR